MMTISSHSKILNTNILFANGMNNYLEQKSIFTICAKTELKYLTLCDVVKCRKYAEECQKIVLFFSKCKLDCPRKFTKNEQKTNTLSEKLETYRFLE